MATGRAWENLWRIGEAHDRLILLGLGHSRKMSQLATAGAVGYTYCRKSKNFIFSKDPIPKDPSVISIKGWLGRVTAPSLISTPNDNRTHRDNGTQPFWSSQQIPFRSLRYDHCFLAAHSRLY